MAPREGDPRLLELLVASRHAAMSVMLAQQGGNDNRTL
jgi:hypothetical protein